MNPIRLHRLMTEIVDQLPDHPVSVMYLCLKHDSDDVTMSDVRAALLYLNEEGRIYFDEVSNVLRRPNHS